MPFTSRLMPNQNTKEDRHAVMFHLNNHRLFRVDRSPQTPSHQPECKLYKKLTKNYLIEKKNKYISRILPTIRMSHTPPEP
jgi:3-hydroxy-3-methylglutaryl CoA synthase